ncbi:MAG: SDR family NAD(P)-dependent oxidoreductase [Chloroflexota bacterium]
MSTDIRGKWALVTGASSGLGVDFAGELAARGANLILAARRQERLEAVRDTITAAHNVSVEVVAIDLAAPDAPQQLHDQLKAREIPVDILVNNAGLGIYGEFTEIEWERERAMLELDIVTLTHMTKLFTRDMVARGFGMVLQVASIGAYQPSPLYASYSAAKSYVLNFGLALNHELRRTGVSVTVVSPGVTRTEFLDVAGQEPTLYQRMAMMTSDAVAKQAIRALVRRDPHIITGTLNALTAITTRFMPRSFAAAIAYRTMK